MTATFLIEFVLLMQPTVFTSSLPPSVFSFPEQSYLRVYPVVLFAGNLTGGAVSERGTSLECLLALGVSRNPVVGLALLVIALLM